jgi:hypothetical protein
MAQPQHMPELMHQALVQLKARIDAALPVAIKNIGVERDVRFQRSELPSVFRLPKGGFMLPVFPDAAR